MILRYEEAFRAFVDAVDLTEVIDFETRKRQYANRNISLAPKEAIMGHPLFEAFADGYLGNAPRVVPREGEKFNQEEQDYANLYFVGKCYRANHFLFS